MKKYFLVIIAYATAEEIKFQLRGGRKEFFPEK